MERGIIKQNNISELISLSKKDEHPYFYRFKYSFKNHSLIAFRVRKDTLIKRDFHNSYIDDNSYLSNAIVKLDNIKQKILNRS